MRDEGVRDVVAVLVAVVVLLVIVVAWLGLWLARVNRFVKGHRHVEVQGPPPVGGKGAKVRLPGWDRAPLIPRARQDLPVDAPAPRISGVVEYVYARSSG